MNSGRIDSTFGATPERVEAAAQLTKIDDAALSRITGSLIDQARELLKIAGAPDTDDVVEELLLFSAGLNRKYTKKMGTRR